MPSSTSSSEPTQMIQYDRALPHTSFGKPALIAILTFLVLVGGWEVYWRLNDVEPSYRDIGGGLWTIERRRINQGEGHKTVLLGSSRILYNTQLDIWEQESGERPIQLALAGTSPLPAIESLADDPDFTGTLIVGVAPMVWATEYLYYDSTFGRFEHESPSKWIGQRISMLFEPLLAFYNYDFALFAIIERQSWNVREGVSVPLPFRRLEIRDRDRNTRMWTKVEESEEYAKEFIDFWMEPFAMEGPPPPEMLAELKATGEDVIARSVIAVDKLEQRGVDVIFIRNPTSGGLAEVTEVVFSRAENWDVLIERTGSLGLHYQDHEEMQVYELPEWSHMIGADADIYTKDLYHLVQRELTSHKAGGP